MCPTADGYSLPGTVNIADSGDAGSGITGTSPSINMVGTSGNTFLLAAADVNGTNWTTRSWSLSATEEYYAFSNGNSTQAVADGALTGGTDALGLTGLPAGAQTRLMAIEIAQGAPPPTTFTGLIGDDGKAILTDSGLWVTV